jgi:hypothetical protein
MNIMEVLIGVARECWHILNDSSPYILFGIFMAGVLKVFMPEDFVARHLGTGDVASVLKASLLGVPLPLCSCGVVPVAMGLRKQGAGKGATTAFLISTPETGADSVAITYALLDPIMTVIRPVAAFITATVAGVIVNVLPEKNEPEAPAQSGAGCGCKSSCGAGESVEREELSSRLSMSQRVRYGLGFAFGELIADIGLLLLLGIVIAGAITFFVPDGFIERNLGAGIKPMLIMLVVGIPVYVCATSSTPIVAALALKGLSPGAALIFLLVGPATNTATITVLSKLMGKRVTVVYVIVIAVVSLVLGIAVNNIYGMFSISVTGWVAGADESKSGILAAISSLFLIGLIVKARLPRSK